MQTRLARDSHGDLASLKLPARRQAKAIQFDSLSEAAIAVLLEKYCKGWECIPGRTFQVEAAGRRIDFMIPSSKIAIEYHPIDFKREFVNSEAHQRLLDALRPFAREAKVEVWKAIRDELASQYWKRRRQALDAAGFNDSRLIVAISPEDLHDRFFSTITRCPNRAGFCAEFRKLLKAVK
jgi:hypothetical protein